MRECEGASASASASIDNVVNDINRFKGKEFLLCSADVGGGVHRDVCYLKNL